MKICILIIISFLFSGIFTYLSIPVSSDIISTLYNTIGIVFSIGMGLVVTFSLSGVKNIAYVHSIRMKITQIRDKFIYMFVICTTSYILSKIITVNFIYNINIFKIIQNFTLSFFVISIIYFVINFIQVQKLKDDIFDQVLQEENSSDTH